MYINTANFSKCQMPININKFLLFIIFLLFIDYSKITISFVRPKIFTNPSQIQISLKPIFPPQNMYKKRS